MYRSCHMHTCACLHKHSGLLAHICSLSNSNYNRVHYSNIHKSALYKITTVYVCFCFHLYQNIALHRFSFGINLIPMQLYQCFYFFSKKHHNTNF